ncbi:MAG: ABC transporter ATP-binding protein, partial [Pirellulales bacterium]
SQLHASSALIFFGSLFASAYACIRLIRIRTEYQETSDKVQAIVQLLSQLEKDPLVSGQEALPAIQKRISLDHVTLRDSEGRRLLEDVCMDMEPGKLVAIIGSDRLQARAVAEILLGFGRPSSGRILLDGVNTIDVDPLALRGTSAWIGPDGPLIAGTLEDNLHQRKSASLVELTEAVRDAGVYDAIQNLSDGLTTLVSPHDDRLKPDYLFRLGIARTLVKNPTLVVAEEPTARVLPQVEAETLEALHQMTRRGMFVVVLPNRLTTLRHAHQIVVLHENRVSAIGTHAELLEQSELYRHLNYIRFSPLRHILA